MKSFLNNLKVAHQIIIVTTLIMLSFIMIVYFYYSTLSAERKQSDNIARLENFESVIDEANIELQKTRRAEKEFLLSGDFAKVSQFTSHWDDTRNALDMLQVTAPKQLSRDDAIELHKHVTNYGNSFRNMANLKKQLTDGEEGLIPKLQRVSEKIENQIRGQNNLNLIGPVMIMRNQERKFAFDMNPQRLKRISGDVGKLAAQLKNAKMAPAAKTKIGNNIGDYRSLLKKAMEVAGKINEINLAYTKEAALAEPIFTTLLAQVKKYITSVKAKAKSDSKALNNLFLFILGGAGIWVVALLMLIQRTMGQSIKKLIGTVRAVQDGDFNARTGMRGSNEFSQFGQTLDQMLNDRINAAHKAETENEALNNSIINLLETAAQLSSNDLTVKATVTADVTGPLADAINQMVTETVRVLKSIQSLAQDVNDASNRVRGQGDTVISVAQQERSLLEQTMERLSAVTQSMKEVAKLAQTCNQFAQNASQNTDLAVETVHNTAKGMHEIRESISETEKRIKRLGERSQEITGIVDIINTIAERTHVLALNASMQAAAAGEAGRGFAVVADEVQRLAESSRNSTSQIASLVQNIQSETAEAMVTMNETITQVVAGSELAEKAGQQMLSTKDTTEKLAGSVEKIANQSLEQSERVVELQKDAEKLRDSTFTTNRELDAQIEVTVQLVEHAKKLNESVNTFALPA